jgi:hypothetical protein
MELLRLHRQTVQDAVDAAAVVAVAAVVVVVRRRVRMTSKGSWQHWLIILD